MNDMEFQNKLELYHRILFDWNRRIRLVGERDSHRFRSQHMEEALNGFQLISGIQWRTGIDIGSGNGLLSVPMACAFPKKKIIALEPKRKKCTFLRHISHELKIPNLEICRERLEGFHLPKNGAEKYLWTARAIEIPPDVIKEKLQQYPGSFFLLYTVAGGRSHLLLDKSVGLVEVVKKKRVENSNLLTVLAKIL